MFKYDTHLHTSQASACARSKGSELARAYKEKGYTGIFVTDHFFNGNTAVDKSLSWKDRISLFCSGYDDAKEEGDKIGLDVFFGFEYCVNGAEFLVYNLDKRWLLEHEDIDISEPKSALLQMRYDGGFVVQAHPFRQRFYIPEIKLYPDLTEAVEVYNGAHAKEPVFDERALWFAQSFDLPGTAGSDTHSVSSMNCAGILTEEKITAVSEYRNAVLNRKIILFNHENC